jgi:hypothetical protein
MLEFDIGFLGLCNFWSGEGKDLLFLATVFANTSFELHLCYVTWVVFVVTAPEF